MGNSTLATKFWKWVAKTFWPWFKKYVWPILRQYVLDVVKWSLEKLRRTAQEWADSRAKARAEEATKRATEAENAATSAASDAEREKHEAVARVWHEVAEQFRQENEALKAKIAEMTAAAESDIAQRTRDTEPSIDFTGDTPVLAIGDAQTPLPALPASSAQ